VVRIFQDLTAAIDASGMCLFTSFALDAQDYADLLSATTGMQIDPAELMKVGERIWNLQKLYNIRRGFGRRDDTLPARLLNEPLKEGAPAGRCGDLKRCSMSIMRSGAGIRRNTDAGKAEGTGI